MRGPTFYILVSLARPLLPGSETQDQVSQKDLQFPYVTGKVSCVSWEERTVVGGRVPAGSLGLGGRFQGDPPFHVCRLSCDSEPVHVPPDRWARLCTLPGDFPVFTPPSSWVVPGRG